MILFQSFKVSALALLRGESDGVRGVICSAVTICFDCPIAIHARGDASSLACHKFVNYKSLQGLAASDFALLLQAPKDQFYCGARGGGQGCEGKGVGVD